MKKLDYNETGSINNKKRGRYISKRESIFLSVIDVLTLITILIDGSYLGKLIEFNRGHLWAINGVMLISSFFAYQLKKIIRKRASRNQNKERDSIIIL